MKKLNILVEKDNEGGFWVTLQEPIDGFLPKASHPKSLSLALYNLRVMIADAVRHEQKDSTFWNQVSRDWEKISYNLEFAKPEDKPRMIPFTKNFY